MSKQVNSFILPDIIIKDMKDKIKETKKIKTELGFALCADINNQKNNNDKNNRIISKGTECFGTKCSIKVGQCKNTQINVGNFHTHPKSHPTMSITDMVTGCSEKIECIGSVPYNSIRCFTKKTDEEQCINDISPFETEEHEILEKGDKIISAIKNPKILARTNIFKLLRGISQYETQVAIYNSNRFKLLNKHFNHVDII